MLMVTIKNDTIISVNVASTREEFEKIGRSIRDSLSKIELRVAETDGGHNSGGSAASIATP